MEKVFARIGMKHCNNNDTVNDYSQSPNIAYHCNVMNIFSCPFESKEEFSNDKDKEEIEVKYPYKREDLFALHKISFAIEQAITALSELTKQNEIIYEVDFENDKVHEIHTKYNGESESWGWQENVNEQLSKVKPISNIVIRDEQDIYNILTNKEKLEYLLQEYEKHYQLNRKDQQQVCCDENTPCVTNENEEKNIPNNKKVILSIATTESLVVKQTKQQNYSHRGENRHSKNIGDKESDNEKLISNLTFSIKDELEKQEKEQILLLKANKQTIIDFITDNKDSIRIEDLKIYEPVYKCYRQKGHCHICNSLSNIICKNCYNNSHYNIKEVWLCTSHWQQHSIKEHN